MEFWSIIKRKLTYLFHGTTNIRFLLLNELYEEGGKDNPDNYFRDLGNEIKLEGLNSFREELEGKCRLLKPKDWEVFKANVRPYISQKDNKGYHSQLIAALNELDGYVVLKQLGYREIEFLPRKNGILSPDLKGTRNGTHVFLEVKTIHVSDINKDYFSEPSEQRNYLEGLRNLPEGLKGKIKDDIRRAWEQLSQASTANDRKILLLCTSFDFNCLNEEFFLRFEEFLSAKNREITANQLQIEHHDQSTGRKDTSLCSSPSS